MSRFQLLIFTFVIAASFFLVTVSASPVPTFPTTIPQGVLLLLGISSTSFLVSKGIQFSNDAGVKDRQSNGGNDAGEEDRQSMVQITPRIAAAQAGGPFVKFSASVPRTANQTVTWSIDSGDPGSIDSSSGSYTPPSTVKAPVKVLVKAVSVENPSLSGHAIVTLS